MSRFLSFNILIKGISKNLSVYLHYILKILKLQKYERYVHNVKIAVDAINHNKLKAGLTTLGIIFGVAAVISMLAIGRGAKHEILEQIKQIGTNNIFILPETGDKKDNSDSKQIQGGFSPGLTYSDVQSLKEEVKNIKFISPEINYRTSIIYKRISKKGNIIGVSKSYFDIYNLTILNGYVFSDFHDINKLPVCIISSGLKIKLFGNSDPLGKSIKCGNQWLKVIGVYRSKEQSANKINEIKVNFDENNIYIPYSTMMIRFYGKTSGLSSWLRKMNNDKDSDNDKNIDRVIVQVNNEKNMIATADLISKILVRLHNNKTDFSVLVPELLIKQQQRAKNIFNFVLGAIAAISLIVGGIGIMNIMYASVLERVKEIGIRMSLGANKKDISFQFLSEAVLISILGGLIGVFLGVIISLVIKHIAGINTIISFVSIIIAFVVSVGVGIIFGYAPARQASQKNPIELLRNE